jgi:two-component system response regulator MprA
MSTAPNPSTPRLLFVVDDDVRTARRLASMLEEDGFAVEVMRDGREALDRLEREPPPDAIIADLIMPRAGGIAVLGEARRRWKEIPFVFVTGHPDLLTSFRVPFLPEPLVLTKPVSYAELSSTLQRLLQG